MVRRIVLALAAAALFAGGAPAKSPFSRGVSERELVKELAGLVREAAAARGFRQVRVGEFTPVGTLPVNAGKSLELALSDALGALAGKGADLPELGGTYQFVNSPGKPGQKVVRVKSRLTDSDGNDSALPETEGFIASLGDLARFAGGNVSFKRPPPNATPDEREALWNRQIQASVAGMSGPGAPPPTFVIHDAAKRRLSADADRRYAMEVWAAPEGSRPLPKSFEVVEGMPHVRFRGGDLYEVRLLNFTDVETAVTLGVDGLDSFAFSESRVDDVDEAGRSFQRRPRVWVLPPRQGAAPGLLVVTGWHRDAGRVSRFEVVGYGKGAISQVPTASRDRVGVITATFAPAARPEVAAFSAQVASADRELASGGGDGQLAQATLPQTRSLELPAPTAPAPAASPAPTAPAPGGVQVPVVEMAAESAPAADAPAETGIGPDQKRASNVSRVRPGEIDTVISVRYKRTSR